MATKNVQVPPLGESITEAVLLRWMKADGDAVKVDEPLCELETDKANVELPSPGAGVLRQIKKEGQTIKIGEIVAEISEGAVASASKGETKLPVSADSEVKSSVGRDPKELSPSVRRLVREHEVDPAELKGTGPRGRIIKEDVLEASAKPAIAPEKKADLPLVSPRMGATSVSVEGVRRVPMTKIRKKIAERLVAAQHQAAMLTTFNEVDMGNCMELRERHKESFQKAHGVGLGIMSFFARAVVLGLRDFPALNAYIENDEIVFHDFVNLGIAVSTDRGLVVPVLRHAERMGFAKIESEIKRMATSAREGKLQLDELSGGTFTITNGGVFGSLFSTPILNPPQSGILGLHTIQKRPVVRNDQVVVRPMMYVAVSYDHRIVDGKESVGFLVKVKELLEDPTRLMLEI